VAVFNIIVSSKISKAYFLRNGVQLSQHISSCNYHSHVEFETKLHEKNEISHINDLKPPIVVSAIKMSNALGSFNDVNCLVAFTWQLTK